MRGVWTLLIVGCALLFLSAAVAAQKRGGDPKLAALKNPVPANAAAVTAGRNLYAKNCRHCHGLRGKGDGTWEVDERVYQVAKDPVAVACTFVDGDEKTDIVFGRRGGGDIDFIKTAD